MTDAENNPVSEPPRRWLNIVAWLMTVAIAVGIVLLIKWAGLAFNVVKTDSMEPTLKPSDMVLTVGSNIHQPQVGDVAIFTTEYLGSAIPPHIHRIVGIDSSGDFITQGDNSPRPDPWRVAPQNVIGVEIASMPSAWIRNPFLYAVLIFLVCVIAFWPRRSVKSQAEEQAPVTGR